MPIKNGFQASKEIMESFKDSSKIDKIPLICIHSAFIDYSIIS